MDAIFKLSDIILNIMIHFCIWLLQGTSLRSKIKETGKLNHETTHFASITHWGLQAHVRNVGFRREKQRRQHAMEKWKCHNTMFSSSYMKLFSSVMLLILLICFLVMFYTYLRKKKKPLKDTGAGEEGIFFSCMRLDAACCTNSHLQITVPFL